MKAVMSFMSSSSASTVIPFKITMHEKVTLGSKFYPIIKQICLRHEIIPIFSQEVSRLPDDV